MSNEQTRYGPTRQFVDAAIQAEHRTGPGRSASFVEEAYDEMDAIRIAADLYDEHIAALIEAAEMMVFHVVANWTDRGPITNSYVDDLNAALEAVKGGIKIK